MIIAETTSFRFLFRSSILVLIRGLYTANTFATINIDRFKVSFAKTNPCQIALKPIGVGYAMTPWYLRVEFLAQVGTTMNALADESQPAVTDDIGIGLFNREALHGSRIG
jgi:hypothetical protein